MSKVLAGAARIGLSTSFITSANMLSSPLILASSSPYRRELLQRLELPFQTETPDVDESPLLDEPPRATAERLAHAKASAIAAKFRDALIIGSDQVAHLGPLRFDKPLTVQRAIVQLSAMSGKSVCFSTALCVLNARTGEFDLCTCDTIAHFRTLSKEEIVRYVERERPLDCAGSAKAEGLGITLLESLQGDDPTALIGLPLIALSRMLRQHGMQIP
jgi:septum formation protein